MANHSSIKDILINKKEELIFYSPYNFIPAIDKEKQFQYYILGKILNFSDSINNYCYQVKVNTNEYWFYYSYLDWDTNFFGRKTYKLSFVIYPECSLKDLTEAIKIFRHYLFSETEKIYCFIDVPTEDILLMQALCGSGFLLIETRLNYYFTKGKMELPEQRYPVSFATPADKENLIWVTTQMSNKYDRFHAEPAFSKEIADKFVATYSEKAIDGYCDAVLVPNDGEGKADALFACTYLTEESRILEHKIARGNIAAVLPTRKGWFKKLVSEMVRHYLNNDIDTVFMNTQSSNRAVINSLSNLNFNLGSITHIFSSSK